MELYLLCPICLTACTERTLPLPTYMQPAFTQGHAAFHPSDMACVGTKSTHQLHTSTAPDMHLTGESLARRLTTPLCQGRLTDQYTLAGERSLGALLFYMSSPGRTFETRPHRNSVSRPHSALSMYFTSLERGIKMKNMNSNNQSPNTCYT